MDRPRRFDFRDRRLPSPLGGWQDEGVLQLQGPVQEHDLDDADWFLQPKLRQRVQAPERGLDWLLIDHSTAEFRGTATIKGLPGTYVFRAIVQDGASIGEPDRLELRIWPIGADTFHDSPRFQATGDVGGQIQIQR